SAGRFARRGHSVRAGHLHGALAAPDERAGDDGRNQDPVSEGREIGPCDRDRPLSTPRSYLVVSASRSGGRTGRDDRLCHIDLDVFKRASVRGGGSAATRERKPSPATKK